MEFFRNKIVRIVAAVLFVLGAAVLILGGSSQESLNGLLVAVVAGISALGGVLTLVSSKNKNHFQIYRQGKVVKNCKEERMKKEFLIELGIAEDLAAKIMAENGKDIQREQNKFADYTILRKEI